MKVEEMTIDKNDLYKEGYEALADAADWCSESTGTEVQNYIDGVSEIISRLLKYSGEDTEKKVENEKESDEWEQ